MSDSLQFEVNLAQVLACTVLIEAKQEYSPNGVCDHARNDDDAAPDPGDSAAKTMRAWEQYMPGIMRGIGAELPAFEQARLRAAKATSPGYSNLQTKLYAEHGPRLAEISQGIDASNRLAGANADLGVLAGPGSELVDQSLGLMRRTDPEFFDVREKTAGSLMELLGGGLTPGEEEAISRRVAQENIRGGTAGVGSAGQTAKDAMVFGEAARNRQLQGVNAATSFLPQSRTGVDPTQLALGRPSINTGDSKFMGVQQESGQGGAAAQNAFDTFAGFQSSAMDINAQRRDWMDRVNEGIGSINF